MCTLEENELRAGRWVFFDELDSKSMPKLKSFDFSASGSDATYDVNHLLIFLSHRPIEKLRFIMNGSDGLMFAALSVEAIQALGNMSSLVSLELNISSLWLENDAVARLILPGSWPALKSLNLTDTCQSIQAFDALLLASPNLEKIEISSYSDTWYFPALQLFQMNTCPSLRCLSLHHTGGRTRDFDSQFLRRFVDVLVNLGQLKKVHLWCAKIDLKVLHMILSKLKLSPIELFRFPPVRFPHEESKEELTAFQLVMQRSLTHLTEVWPGHSGTDSPCVQGMQRTLADGTMFPFEDMGQSILKFSTARDENGRDGREAFFDHVYQLLTDDEKATLADWDDGNYGLEA